MPEKKKIMVKVKKRRLKVKKILVTLLIMGILVLSFLYIKRLPITNIYIVGNNILSDKEIIDISGIGNYPSFITTLGSNIKDNLIENNYIKELGELAKENINFSHSNKIGGSYTIEGTQWTIASMVAQEAGIPLLFPLSKDKYNENSSFLSGCYTLGEILEKQGYQNRILMGSDANFGCTSNFYKQHGNFKIEDTTSLKKEGRLPQDYHVFWGFEDKKVFEFAKEDLTEMAKSNQPFCMELVTIDTHTPDGYICDECKHEYDSQYANVISCQSRQVEAFVRWCQKQEWYENTTIVITGDHKSMSEKFFKHLDKSYLRTPYNCFINSAIEPPQPKNRKFAIFDFYPTILASLGVKIKGEHLGLGTNLFSDEKTLLEKYGVKKINSEVAKYSQFYRKILINKQKNV